MRMRASLDRGRCEAPACAGPPPELVNGGTAVAGSHVTVVEGSLVCVRSMGYPMVRCRRRRRRRADRGRTSRISRACHVTSPRLAFSDDCDRENI